MHELVDDLVEHVGVANSVEFADVLFVPIVVQHQLAQLLGVLNHLDDRLMIAWHLARLVWLLFIAVSCYFVDVFVLAIVDSSLIEDVELLRGITVFGLDVDFDLGKARNEAVLVHEFRLVDLVSCLQRLTERFQDLDKPLSLSRAEAAQELELVVPVLMLYQEVDVDSDVVYGLDVDFFKGLKETSLVDVLLKRMQVDVESLILAHDWTPQVEYLVHRVLFPSRQANGLFQYESVILQQLLTEVA